MKKTIQPIYNLKPVHCYLWRNTGSDVVWVPASSYSRTSDCTMVIHACPNEARQRSDISVVVKVFLWYFSQKFKSWVFLLEKEFTEYMKDQCQIWRPAGWFTLPERWFWNWLASLACRCASSWLSTTMLSSAGASSISPSPSSSLCRGTSVRSSRTRPIHVRHVGILPTTFAEPSHCYRLQSDFMKGFL